jgi:hypothetical protein
MRRPFFVCGDPQGVRFRIAAPCVRRPRMPGVAHKGPLLLLALTGSVGLQRYEDTPQRNQNGRGVSRETSRPFWLISIGRGDYSSMIHGSLERE